MICHLFLEKYDTYPVDGEENIRIDLSKNYRSREEVVNTVNSVFERIMSKEVGGIEYDENAKLYARAEYVESEGNESEFLLIETPEKEDELNAKQAEAKAIALKIMELKKKIPQIQMNQNVIISASSVFQVLQRQIILT